MKNTLIYGSGIAGTDIAKELKQNYKTLKLKVVGFIDDDPKKLGTSINRIRILGSRKNLPNIVKKYKIDQVILAIPSAPGEEIAKIIKEINKAKVSFLIVPRVKEIIEGKAHFSGVRKVEVEDLLGRPVIRTDNDELKNFFKGKKVLVTGAAGSIGSELVRQIAAYKPDGLLLFDWWESGTFDVLHELKRDFPNLKNDYAIGNIQDEDRVGHVWSNFKPDFVFHAAAYKHVPLMEDHPIEAVKNNVFGTFNVANTSKNLGVDRFVMVSTDKAAEPVNVMGMTKLIAESIVNSIDGATKYMTVRFGNVLDSYGSVIPIFRKQIERGGPVTITDKRMTRFFMTIPEAAQLILKAGMLGDGKELFVLDMGKPVKITDLAQNLIRLSGFVPGKDIKIIFTGVRPGEKIEERLFNESEKLLPTKHEKIFLSSSSGLANVHIPTLLKDLKGLVAANNPETLRKKFKEIKKSFPG